jgi:hypothetical protein
MPGYRENRNRNFGGWKQTKVPCKCGVDCKHTVDEWKGPAGNCEIVQLGND